MKLSTHEMLRILGSGESIDSVAEAAGITRAEFTRWWESELSARVSGMTGSSRVAVRRTVEIQRDDWGTPHIFAENDDDLFFGFGYALAQDRLFQLDYLRRKATGRLAEILGPDGVESDTLARTVGIHRIVDIEERSLPEEAQRLLKAFSEGINAVINESQERLPIEFDLLDYRPDPWSARDCLAIEKDFQWYLTGRFSVIVIPESAKRILGDGPLYRAFLEGEDDEESIVPAGPYAAGRGGSMKVGETVGDQNEGQGSNNWVVSGKRTVTGKPLLASDPHIAFAAVSCWYEVHLNGGSFHTAGISYAGLPALLFGRNKHVAWGVTNNICSQRDLYLEKVDSDHPGCFLYDGKWEPARKLVEEIKVRGSETLHKTIHFSRNGPIVDGILPIPAKNADSVSLKWLGADYSGWLFTLQKMNRAESAGEFREVLKTWKVPTFNMVFADVKGHIGYHVTGQIPIRKIWERGFRPGWDPEHGWSGFIPFYEMPRLADPERGWIVTANNRPAPDDYPYPLSGTWNSGYRARRIRQMIESKDSLSQEDFFAMQQDVLSLRALECVPKLLKALAANPSSNRDQAIEFLSAWDCRMELDRVGASIFEIFFVHWCRAVVKERFSACDTDFFAGAVGGLARRLLDEDNAGWFESGSRQVAIVSAFDAALDELSRRLGPDLSQWTWGNAHKISLRHVLSRRGDLSKLLDSKEQPARGNHLTVCNTGYDPNLNRELPMGSNYRLVVDLSNAPAGLWTVDAQGQSGQPGSPHYCDQRTEWMAGGYHYLLLDCSSQLARKKATLILQPLLA